MVYRGILGAAATLLVLLLAACGGAGSSEEGGASSEGQEQLSVLVLLPSLEDESYIRQQRGAQAEADKHPDVDIEIDAGTGRDSAPSLISKIESALTRGVDVIAINPGGGGNQVRPTLQRAVDQGVKVIAFDQGVPDFPELTSYIEVDDGGGSLSGEYMTEQLSQGDQVGIIRCFAGNTVMDARMSSLESGLGDGLEIVSELDAKCDPAAARTSMENMLTANPELDGVWSDTDVALGGALEALEAENKDLVVCGHDGQIPIIEAIAAGDIVDCTSTNPFEETGEMAVSLSIQAGQEEEIPSNPVLEVQLVTQENAEEVLQEIEQIEAEVTG